MHSTTTGAHDPQGAGGGAWFDRWATQYDGERRLLISPFDAFDAAAAEAATLRADGTSRVGDEASPGARDHGLAARAGGASAPIRVLDLGAGTGLLSAALADALPGCELTLLDEAPGMLAQARERLAPLGDRVQVVEGDLLSGMPDGPFDVIASALAIHHLDPADQARTYAEARRRLAPGGVFVNAEQLAGPSAALEHHYVARELVHARAGGFSAEAEAQARIRWSVDRHVPLETQLQWLHEAGYASVDCVMKSWRFAVLAAWQG